MRKNLKITPVLYPMPVLILATYSKDGTPNAMTAAWGGVIETDEIALCISANHKTTENFLARGAFTVSMGIASQYVACDYVGIVSGKKVPDKFVRAGFHAVKSETVDAPLIAELPLAMECLVQSYDHKRRRLIGKVVNVSADEQLLGKDGKIDPEKADFIVFDTFGKTYYRLGEKVGDAYTDGKKLF